MTVKRTQHGVISDPHTIKGNQRLGEALAEMERTKVGMLAVVDAEGRLIGLLTERDARFVSTEKRVCERMMPRNNLTAHTGSISLGGQASGNLLGLITAKDILNHKKHPFASRDALGYADRPHHLVDDIR